MNINKFIEYPRVDGQYNRNIVFPSLHWISKKKFEEEITINDNLEIHPCLNEDKPFIKRIFLGKLIPNPDTSILLNSEGQLNSELIGSVYYSEEKIWKLKITFFGQTYEIREHFLILNIEDRNAYFWKANDAFQTVHLPLFALKVSFDSSDSYYQYAGRRLKQSDSSRDSIIFYSNAWLKIENQNELNFGKIKTNLRLLMVPYENMEIGHSSYEVLCLKASPSSLKVLCRSAIRKYLNHSQKKIKSLNYPSEKKYYIPDILVDYLKYPSFLKIGDCFLKEEKLVDENDEYELSIDQNSGDLKCKKLTECVEKSKEWILQKNADCILLHPFNTVFYCSSRKQVIKNNFLNSNNFIVPYKFFVNWEKLTFEIKYL